MEEINHNEENQHEKISLLSHARERYPVGL
jgi:hypothetical protein